MIEEIKTKENELRDLLTASNTRMEEIELQVFEQEERVEKLTSELENVTKGKFQISNFSMFTLQIGFYKRQEIMRLSDFFLTFKFFPTFNFFAILRFFILLICRFL